MSFFPKFFAIPAPLIPVLQSIWAVWSAVWWIVLPIVAAIIAWEAWKLYLHFRFAHNIKWKLLEIKIPKNVEKTPKAMEQIFAAAHAPYSYGIRFFDKYWKGMDEYWMAFELVSRGGETHFYLRVPVQFRNMMEAAIYGQYPEAEIFEAPDYLEEMPHELPNADFDLSGFEEVLRHENYLPIRTYEMFESPVEEQRLDPIAGLMEAMSKLGEGEQLWYQVIVRPTGEAFKEEGEEEMNKVLGIEHKEEHSSGGFLPSFDLGFSAAEALRAPFEHPGFEVKEKKEEKKESRGPRLVISPVEKERVEGIGRKIAKIAFEATVRFVYVERTGKDFDPNHTMSIHGFVRQFNTQHLNSLRPYSPTTTASYAVRGLFKKTRLRWRKRLMYENYRHTIPMHHESILNIEELATIFHFPLGTVTTAELEKVESRKGNPPPSLPLVED